MADSITAEDLLQPVKNTVAADMFSPLAKEKTLQVAVSELTKMNLALKNQAKDSDDLRQELEDETKEALDFYKEISSLLEDMEKDGTKSNKTVTTRIDKAVKALTKKSEYTSAKSSDPTRKVGEMKGAGVSITPKLNATSAVEYGNELTDAIKRATQSMVGTVLSGVLGGTDAYRIITKGMIEEQYDFASEMNKIAFRTKGITDSSRDMQQSFRATSDVVRETGFDIGMMQNQVVRGAKRGLKDSQSIAKIGLGLGKLIGANEQEAASLSDTFFDWNQNLGMSKTQLGSIAHEIKEVSKYTGLVGENLANAVKGSEKYLDKMKSAGNLTAAAANNTIALQAATQKRGIDDSSSDIMNALNSMSDFLDSSDQTKSLLLTMANRSGENNNLLSGSIKNSKQSLRNMAEGGRGFFKSTTGFDVKDVDKMNVEEKARADLKLKRITGKGLGDYLLTLESLDEAGAGFSDKMGKIENDLKNATSSEEKLALERKKQDLYLTESMSNSSVFAEAAKKATSLEDAVSRMQNTMNPDQVISYNKELASVAGTFSEDLKAKVLSGDKTAIAEAINLSAADAIKKAGGGDYTQRVKTAISNKDTKKLITLQEKMSKEQQKLGIKDSTIGDPIEKATDQIKLMNENLLSFTGPAVMLAAQTAGSTGIMAGLMALIVAQGYFGAESIRAWGEVFMGGFKSLKDTFAKGVAENATEVISPIAEAMSTASAPIAGAARVSPMTAAMATASAPVATTGLAAGTGATVGATTAATGATTTAGAAATLTLGTVALGVAVLGAAVGALTGSYWAGQEAASHFNTEIEDLTLNQLYASKGAGLLAGALNFLTLGIFNNWLGATGSLTAMLARFNEKLPILSAVAGLLDVIFGAFYGIYKFVVNFLSGIVDAISIVLSPLIDAVGSVVGGISSIIGAFTSLSPATSSVGNLFSIVSDTIGWFGTVLGGLVKVIGYVVKIALSPLIMGLSGLGDLLGGVGKVLKGIFSLDASMIFEGVKQQLLGGIKILAGLFFDIPVKIFTVLKDIGPMIFNAFKSIFIDLPKYLWDSFFVGLKSLTENDIFGEIFKPFLEILEPINKGVYAVVDAFYTLIEPFNALFGIFSSTSDETNKGAGLLGLFTSGLKMLSSVIGGFLRVVLFPLSLGFQIIGGVLQLVAGFITTLKDALMDLVGIIKYTVDAIISPFEYLYDVLVGHSIIPDLVFAVIGCFSGMASSVLGGLFSFAPKVLSLFDSVKGGIIDSASSAMSYIKSTDIFSSIVSNFNLATDAVSNFFSPLMKGFSRARQSGAGLFSSFKRGASSQYNSMTKGGKSISTAMEKGKGLASTAMEKGKGLIGMAKRAAPSVVEFAGKFMGKAGSIIGGLVGKAGLKTAGKSILKKLPGIGAIAGAGFALSELMQGNIGGAIREFGSGILGAIPVVGPVLSFAVDMFGDYVIDGAKSIGSFLWDGAKSIGSFLWDGAKSIGSFLWDGAKSSWNWLFGNEEKVVQKSSKSADAYSNYVSPSQLVTPENTVKPASVQPTGYVSNVHDKIRRNKVEENSNTSKNGSVHLSELVVINNEMLHYMMMNEQNTAKLVELLTSTGSLSGETNGKTMKTKGNSKPRNSSNYNQWQFGRYDQNASLQVVTIGV